MVTFQHFAFCLKDVFDFKKCIRTSNVEQNEKMIENLNADEQSISIWLDADR